MLKQRIALDYYAQIFLQALSAIAGLIVARVAGPSVLGTLAFGMSFAFLFSFIPDLNMGIAHIKLISSGEDFGKCNATFTVIKFVLTGIFLVFVFVFILLQKYIFHLDFSNKTQEQVIAVFIVVVVISSLASIPVATFMAKMQSAKKNLPLLFEGAVSSALKVLVVLLGFGALAIALSNLFAAVLGCAFLFYLFRKYPFSGFDASLAKKYFKVAFPTLLAITVIPTVIMHVDKVILQYFVNSEEVGYYSAALRISYFVKVIGFSFAAVFFPLASGHISNGNYAEVKGAMVKFERFIYLFIMPLTIFAAICAPQAVRILLGSKYAYSASVLSVTMIAVFALLLAKPYMSVLLSAGFFKDITVLAICNMALFILAECFFVMPAYLNLGAIGTGLALLASNLFLFIVFRACAIKRMPELKVRFDARYILYGVVNFAVFYYAYRSLPGLYNRVLLVPVYFLFTYLSMRALKLIKKSDFRMLMDILSVKTMRDYVIDEFHKDPSEDRSF